MEEFNAYQTPRTTTRPNKEVDYPKKPMMSGWLLVIFVLFSIVGVVAGILLAVVL